MKIVAEFKALSLDVQTEAYPQITAAFNASKDARRLQLEAEIRALGFKPGEGKKKPDRAVKYRGPQGEDGGWRYGRLAEEAEGCR